MSTTNLRKIPMNRVSPTPQGQSAGWLWDGYLKPGSITLLTSQWKTGKTTLLTGLLRCLEHGEAFLGRAMAGGKGLVVSEESNDHWAERLSRMPVGGHVELMSRPFLRRPNFDQWNSLIDEARDMRLTGQLDLFVIDPMAKFLPGAWESNAGLLFDALEPLHRLTSEGVSVLLLHHPRKQRSEPGHAARGTGALLGFVDIAVELNRYGRLRSDSRRRLLLGLARSARTPERLVYEWDPATGRFTELGDPLAIQFEQNWSQVLEILRKRKQAATHKELLMDWPSDQEKPSASVLYEWLNRAFAEKRVRRHGSGTTTNPYRYRLENEDDKYLDQGKLPPLGDLTSLRGW
jgi:hypothetical protein